MEKDQWNSTNKKQNRFKQSKIIIPPPSPVLHMQKVHNYNHLYS